tara:strand:- start:10025 stop:11521 length:1497 start_codon:yes stop_codon:yes gene_type:complete
MKKLFFSISIILLSQIFSNQFLNRFTNKIDNRQLNTHNNLVRNETELLNFIESIVITNAIPGLSISVVENENIVWDKHFGYGNIENNILVNENTMYILSSISKTITATALMQLYEDNQFMLDDDIDDYLQFNVNHPDFPFVPITFKMLLSHTSGIKDNWNVMPYYDGDSPLELEYYLNQYFVPGGNLYNENLNFTNSIPGSNYNYSNIGAALIGLLVEKISNQPFNEYCNDNIFSPLEMNDSYWFLSEIENLEQIALPYQFNGGNGNNCFEIGCGIYDESNPCFCDYACIEYNDCCFDYEDVCGENGSGSNPDNLMPYTNYGYSDYPSGQLRSSSNNLAKFMGAFINNGIFNNTRILDSESVELIKTIHYPNINSNQGLIWYYKNSNGRTLFGHNGGDLGSLTEMFISFSENLGVILLSNTSNYNALIQIEDAIFEFNEDNDFINIGDVNLDSTINVQDVILMINFILNGQYNLIADLNYDSIIDILDIVLIINLILD